MKQQKETATAGEKTIAKKTTKSNKTTASEKPALSEKPASAPRPPTAAQKFFSRDNIEAIVIAVVLALTIRNFVVQAFKIPSGSMEKTLLIGDHICLLYTSPSPRD